ncbi:MAG: TolC family protein [Candidatus Marinimicrobia bacterium]|nr:TolC family protein [Candidatus Neomarinimicrobiota bacterium]
MKIFRLILFLPLLLGAQNQKALSIEESIHMALERNPNIKMAQERINDAKQNVYQALGTALPSASFQGSQILDETVRPIDNFFYVPGVVPDPANPITFLMTNPTLDFDMTNEYQVDLRVTQPLFTGGKIALGTLMARNGLNLIQSQYEDEKNNLSFNVIQAYLGMLVTQQFLDVANEGYETAVEFFDISTLLYEQGMISKLDLLQAEVQAANLLPQKTQAENGITMAAAGLRMLLGLEPETKITLTDSMSYKPGTYSLDDLRQQALMNRSELQQLDISKSLSSLGVKMAMSDYLPTVALSWSYSKFGDELGTMSDWNTSNMLAVGVSYNLFNGGIRFSKLRQARIAERQVNYGYDALKDAILLEVEQVYLRLMEAEKNILSQEKTVGQAVEAARLAKIQFREGTITNLQANQIQINLTVAKANYLQALFNYTLAEASIKKVVGKSLQNEGATN